MFYFFRRGDALIRCEVRTDWDGDGYELVIDRPGAVVRIERFRRTGDLNQRWEEFEQGLLSEGWRGPQPNA